MNTTLKTTLLVSAIAVGAGILFASPAYAQPVNPLVIEFEQAPLFAEANFLPGDTVVRYVRVQNNSGVGQTLGVKVDPYQDPDNLGSQLTVVITQGATELYSGTLDALYAASPVQLSTVGNGGSAHYDFAVTFPAASGNEYQGTSVNFDLQVGILGQEECVGDCGGTDVVAVTGGGGSGGGSDWYEPPQVLGASTSTEGGGGSDFVPTGGGEVLGATTSTPPAGGSGQATSEGGGGPSFDGMGGWGGIDTGGEVEGASDSMIPPAQAQEPGQEVDAPFPVLPGVAASCSVNLWWLALLEAIAVAVAGLREHTSPLQWRRQSWLVSLVVAAIPLMIWWGACWLVWWLIGVIVLTIVLLFTRPPRP